MIWLWKYSEFLNISSSIIPYGPLWSMARSCRVYSMGWDGGGLRKKQNTWWSLSPKQPTSYKEISPGSPNLQTLKQRMTATWDHEQRLLNPLPTPHQQPGWAQSPARSFSFWVGKFCHPPAPSAHWSWVLGKRDALFPKVRKKLNGRITWGALQSVHWQEEG